MVCGVLQASPFGDFVQDAIQRKENSVQPNTFWSKIAANWQA